MRVFTASVFAASLLLASSSSSAQDNTAFAQQRFTRGASLYEARDFARALDEFRASMELYASPNARLYIARCLRELGRYDEAVNEYERAMREANDRAATDPRYVATRDAARSELLAVEPRVSRLTLTIHNAPPNVLARVNDREIPAAALGVPFAVMPGHLVVTAEAPGWERSSREVDVDAGREVTVGFSLRERPRLPGEGPNDPGRVTTPARRGGVPRAVAWASFGVGAAGLVAFGVFAGLASGRFSDIETRCGSAPCPESERAAIDEGRTFTTVANVGLGVGIAGVAAGALFLILSRPSAEPAPPRTEGLRVSVGPTSVTVGGSF